MKISAIITSLARLAPALALVCGAFVAAAHAGDTPTPSWIPQPPKAIGGKCDEDPKWMRRYHMNVLMHKRDKTMHEGVRTKKYSLKRCIACHAVRDDEGRFVTVKDEGHFCRVCHDYTAVKMDCFGCHASRPEQPGMESMKKKKSPHAAAPKKGHQNSSSIAQLEDYLGRTPR